MNKEKFQEIVQEEFERAGGQEVDVDTWPDVKTDLEHAIKEIDKAHEVYTMENPKKK